MMRKEAIAKLKQYSIENPAVMFALGIFLASYIRSPELLLVTLRKILPIDYVNVLIAWYINKKFAPLFAEFELKRIGEESPKNQAEMERLRPVKEHIEQQWRELMQQPQPKLIQEQEPTSIKDPIKGEFYSAIPQVGLTMKALRQHLGLEKVTLSEQQYNEIDNRIKMIQGRLLSGQYYTTDRDLMALMAEIAIKYGYTNAMHSTPELDVVKEMARHAVRMMVNWYKGDDRYLGRITTGGSGSISYLVRAHLAYARHKKGSNRRYNVVLPKSIHASFRKPVGDADIKYREVLLKKNGSVDTEALAKLIDENTVMVAVSDRDYPCGIGDDAKTVSKIIMAKRQHYQTDTIGMVLDSCLAFPANNGNNFNSLPALTGISADIHKKTGSDKNVSVALIEKKRTLTYPAIDWDGGAYVTGDTAGSYSAIQAIQAYATLLYHGISGLNKIQLWGRAATIYLAKKLGKVTKVVGKPTSETLAVYGDDTYRYQGCLKECGVLFNALSPNNKGQQRMHMTTTPASIGSDQPVKRTSDHCIRAQAEKYATFVADAYKKVRAHCKANPNDQFGDSAPLYGHISKISELSGPVRAVLGKLIFRYLAHEVTKMEATTTESIKACRQRRGPDKVVSLWQHPNIGTKITMVATWLSALMLAYQQRPQQRINQLLQQAPWLPKGLIQFIRHHHIALSAMSIWTLCLQGLRFILPAQTIKVGQRDDREGYSADFRVDPLPYQEQAREPSCS